MEAYLNKHLPKLKLKENETLVLFLNDDNGWYKDNPIASLVVVENYDYSLIKENEKQQPGVGHFSGDYELALAMSKLNYTHVIHGKASDFVGIVEKYHNYETYNVISGT